VERKVPSQSNEAIAGQAWDQAWAEYDARQPRRAPPAMPTVQRAATIVSAKPRRRRGWLGVLLVAPLVGGAANWLGAPVSTAWQLGQAIEARDSTTLAPLLDQGAVQQAAGRALAEAARGPGGAEASAFLAGMAAEMTEAWGSPRALTEVARARGVSHGAAAEALRNLRPQGVTALDLPLGGAAPMTLRLELREAGLAPRWQVTEVRLEGGAQPVAAAPPMRLSALR